MSRFASPGVLDAPPGLFFAIVKVDGVLGGRQASRYDHGVPVYVAPMARNLVGVAEIAEMLGVTRQRVHQLAKTPGFPAPLAELSAGAIWDRADVERWARKTGRLS